MMSTSIDSHYINNGRPLRIVSTSQLFTKVRTEQPSESGMKFFDKFNRNSSLVYFVASITINNRWNKFIF